MNNRHQPADHKSKQDEVPEILYEYLPKLEKYVSADTIFYPYDQYLYDSTRVMAIGKFIDKKAIYAIDSSFKDSVMSVYHYDKPEWKIITSTRLDDMAMEYRFEDLNGDGRNELLLLGHFNMNGNLQHKIYFFPEDGQPVHLACHFFGNYEHAPGSKSLHYIYTGSWYADYVQTLYEWRNEKLVPTRSVTLSLKKADMKHDAQWIVYSENPTYDQDTLVTIFKKTYREKDKKMYDLVEHFFEIKDTLK